VINAILRLAANSQTPHTGDVGAMIDLTQTVSVANANRAVYLSAALVVVQPADCMICHGSHQSKCRTETDSDSRRLFVCCVVKKLV